jgi:intergrase/recombinase
MAEKLTSKRRDEYKPIGVTLHVEDLALLNQRLERDGFKNMGELVRAYLAGEYPKVNADQQVQRMLDRIRDKGIIDATGKESATFWRSVKSADLLAWLLPKYIYKKHAKDLLSYWERYCELFFTRPERLQNLTGHVRANILDAMRRFGEYYDQRYNEPEVRMLVQEIILRYGLNKKMRVKDRLWVADDSDLKSNINKVLNLASNGDLGIIIKTALLTGLRGEELSYLHDNGLCQKVGCVCSLLHRIDKSNGLSIVVLNRIVGQKHSYFTILPSKLFQQFRALAKVTYEERKVCHTLLKNATDGQVEFMTLRKYHYNVMLRSGMGEIGAEVLQGRAKSVGARHYLMNGLDTLSEQYREAWSKFGVMV